MDSSILYLLVFILCLPLSWYIYKELFVDSSFQQKFSDFINSGGKFFLYLFILLLIPSVMLYTGKMTTGILLGLIFHSKDKMLNQGISSVTSVIEPFGFVIVGSILFQFGFKRMSELQLIRNIPV